MVKKIQAKSLHFNTVFISFIIKDPLANLQRVGKSLDCDDKSIPSIIKLETWTSLINYHLTS